MSLPPPPEKNFPTTQWSLVIRLRSADAVVARRAVEDIFTAYRHPVYSYLRGSAMNHEDSEDVLQGFFEKMLRTDSLGDADPARGKLRTFLLTALSRFQSNFQRGERRRQQRVRTEGDLWDERLPHPLPIRNSASAVPSPLLQVSPRHPPPARAGLSSARATSLAAALAR